ncbi:MAG: hypothetical protein ACI31M_00390 [Bacilli bacterium]
MNILDEISNYDKNYIKNEDKLNKILDYSTIDFAFFVSVLMNLLPGGKDNYIVTKILMRNEGGINPIGPGIVKMFCIYRKENIKSIITELQKTDQRIEFSYNIDENRPHITNQYRTGIEYYTINIQPLYEEDLLSNRKYITKIVNYIINNSTVTFNDLFFSVGVEDPYDDSYDPIPRNISLFHPKRKNFITHVSSTFAIDEEYKEYCIQLLNAINEEKNLKNTTPKLLTRKLRKED